MMNDQTTQAVASSTLGRGAAVGTEGGYFGVEGLDNVLPAGLTYENQVLLEGDTGIGKSVLAAQFLYEGLVVGDHCIYIACDEPPNVMRQNMANFRLGTVAYERSGQLVLVDAYSRGGANERYYVPDPTNLDEFFLYEMRFLEQARGRRARLVVDSLSTVLLLSEPEEVVAFSANRLRFLRRAGIFTLDSFVRGTLDDQLLNRMRHAYPIIVNMRYSTTNGHTVRYIQMGKLKSGQFSATQLPFIIDPRSGIVVQDRQY